MLIKNTYLVLFGQNNFSEFIWTPQNTVHSSCKFSKNIVCTLELQLCKTPICYVFMYENVKAHLWLVMARVSVVGNTKLQWTPRTNFALN